MLRVRGTSRVLAVLGDPIAHSLSPAIQNAAVAALGIDAVYVALRVSPGALPDVFRACAAAGIGGNVTVPLKETAATLIDDCTPLARQLGAVNTFWEEGGALHGDNTDVAGLAEVLAHLDAPDPWLVAGTGGSARALAAVAGREGRRLLVRSRDADRAAAFCTWAAGLDAAPRAEPDDGRAAGTVVNATPLGLRRDDPLPLPPDRVAGARVALDLVYAAGETAWVRRCREAGLQAVDGRGLLLAQGAHAFERFFPGQRAPREVMRAALARALRG